MTVDVVIPVFNGARFVSRAVASVLSQGVPVVVHCVDDGSHDDSLAVLDSLAAADQRVRVYRSPANSGVAAARNRAIRAGAAQFLAFLDQDDEWMPAKLEIQLSALASRPDVGWVVGYQQMVLEPGASRPHWCREEWLDGPQMGYLPGTLLARRDAFLAVGLLDETLVNGGDDTDWFARARRTGVVGEVLDEVVLRRWVHGSNGSSNPRTNDDLLALVRRHAAERSQNDGS
jgi:glycosyltransferase involved in cell wall biosynthesis